MLFRICISDSSPQLRPIILGSAKCIHRRSTNSCETIQMGSMLVLVLVVFFLAATESFQGRLRAPCHLGYSLSRKRPDQTRTVSSVGEINRYRGHNNLVSYAGGAEFVPMLSLPAEALGVNFVLASLIKLKGTRSLTDAGLLHAFFLGVGLWSTLGLAGWLYGVAYFVMGTLVTKVKMEEKKELGIAEKRDGARGPENVWGSAATSMLCALGVRFVTGLSPLATQALTVGFTAALATKLSDTFGSEIGKAYGKTCYLITNFKLVPRGTEGAVSVEGTVAGVVASILMALIAQYLGLIQGNVATAAVIVAAFVATTVESYIGAIFQDNVPWLTNELVNLINTLIGAFVGFAVVYLANTSSIVYLAA